MGVANLAGQVLIGIQLLLIFPLVLNKSWIVLTVVRVLPLPYFMHPAPVLAVAVRMVYLHVAVAMVTAR